MYTQASRERPSIHERIFKEALFRAENHFNPHAALEVAFCHEFGIGVPCDWTKCVYWVEMSAKMGSKTACIYLKRLRPDIETFTPIDGGAAKVVNEQIISRLRECKESGDLREVIEICPMIEQTTEFEDVHAEMFRCLCKYPEKNEMSTILAKWRSLALQKGIYTLQGSTVEYASFGMPLLHDIWTHLRLFPGRPLPPSLRQSLRENAQLVHSEFNKNLLHEIAMSQHPKPRNGGPDYVRIIGKLLLANGANCWTDSSLLDDACTFRNYGLVALLLEQGHADGLEIATVEKAAAEHDYELLQLIFPLQLEAYEDIKLRDFQRENWANICIRACAVAVGERKFRYGNEFSRPGVATLEILLNHPLKYCNKIEPVLWQQVIAYLIHKGNSDLLNYALTRQVAIPNIIPHFDPDRALIDCILADRQELFDKMLGLGAKPNSSSAMFDKILVPIDCAARKVTLNTYYFQKLLDLGATVSANAITALVSSKEGAEPLRWVLDRNPTLLETFKEEWKSEVSPIPLLLFSIIYGCYETVEAVLEANQRHTKIKDVGFSAALATIQSPRREAFECFALVMWHLELDEVAFKRCLNLCLVIACRQGNYKVTELLLFLGADPNIVATTEPEFRTAYVAIWLRRMKFTQNMDFKLTARAAVEIENFERMYCLLLENGLDENIRSGENNETAEEYCQSLMERYEMVLKRLIIVITSSVKISLKDRQMPHRYPNLVYEVATSPSFQSPDL